MTAPTIPAPAASEAPATPAVPTAPVTPVIPQIKRAQDLMGGSNDELMARFGLSEMAKETPETPAAPVAEEVAAAPETPAVPEAPKPEEVAAPETPAAPSKPLAATFKVFDKDGELEIPEMEITYQANGKERRDSLDKVVRLAQMGAYNEDREKSVTEQRAKFTQYEAENKKLAAYVDSLRADLNTLFADPSDEMYKGLKAQYAQQNTPEARAERAERALVAERQKGQTEKATQQAQVFSDNLNTYLTKLTEQHPEVTFHEILGRFSELTLPYMQAGRVPPESFPVVAQLVDQELTPWVQHHHQSRTEAKASVQRDADAKIERERQAATTARVMAKRTIARAVPGSAGTTPTPIRETPQAPTYKKADDILKDVGRLVTSSG